MRRLIRGPGLQNVHSTRGKARQASWKVSCLLSKIFWAFRFELVVFREQSALDLLRCLREEERLRIEKKKNRHQTAIERRILHDLHKDFLHHVVEPVCAVFHLMIFKWICFRDRGIRSVWYLWIFGCSWTLNYNARTSVIRYDLVESDIKKRKRFDVPRGMTWTKQRTFCIHNIASSLALN